MGCCENCGLIFGCPQCEGATWRISGVLWGVVRIVVPFLVLYSRANLPFRVSHNGKALGIFGEPAIPDAMA